MKARVAIWSVVLLSIAGYAAASWTSLAAGTPGEGLPFYDSPEFTPRWTRDSAHRIGTFSLLDQAGGAFTRKSVEGRVHVASFIFTRCAGICPQMVTQLKRLQAALGPGDDTLIVSYSVTPEDDPPAMLAKFGEQRGIDPERWKLVTGDRNTIFTLARESYFAEDGRLNALLPPSEQFLHTEKLLLVDDEGRLRGVYNGTLPYEIDKLVADLRLLKAPRE